MAWNEPGGGKDNDPWGGGNRNNEGPPDLDEVIKNLNDKLGSIFGGGGGNGGHGDIKGPLMLIALVLAVFYIYT